MEYEVRLSQRAIKDLLNIYEATSAESSPPAAQWYLALRDTVLSLGNLPARGTIAREKPALRQLLYGNKPHIYRIRYVVDETTSPRFIPRVTLSRVTYHLIAKLRERGNHGSS